MHHLSEINGGRDGRPLIGRFLQLGVQIGCALSLTRQLTGQVLSGSAGFNSRLNPPGGRLTVRFGHPAAPFTSRRWSRAALVVVFLGVELVVQGRDRAVSPADRCAARVSEEFLRQTWPGLVRLGRLLTGSSQVGEDLAPRTRSLVCSASTGWYTHRRAYLRRSVVNFSINQSRRAVRDQRHQHRAQAETVDPFEPDDMWPLIVALPARQRPVLVLRYYEDLSEAQIANILGCRPGTVKSLAARALAHLKQELTP